MKRLSATISLLAFALLFAGCERDQGSDVDDIARLFVALRMESRTWEGQPERARQAREKLLRTAGMSLPEWRRRVRALQSDPDLWAPFWDKAKQITDSIDNHAKLPKSKGS